MESDQPEIPASPRSGTWKEGRPDGRYRPENRFPGQPFQTREGELEGRHFQISSGFVEVETGSGVRAKARVIMVDFRIPKVDQTEKNKVYIGCSGFPGLSPRMRDGVLSGDLSSPEVRQDLDFLMIREAQTNSGVAILPEMHRLPSGSGSASFSWDGEAVLDIAEKFSAKAAPGSGISFKDNVSEVYLSGYSNGAGEVLAAAMHLCRQHPPGAGPDLVNLRLYSLIGVVPVEHVARSFGREVWGLAMIEIADRFYRAQTDPDYPLDPALPQPQHIDTSVPGNDKRLISEVWKFIRTQPDGWNRFLAQVRSSAQAEEGGNLQIGMDLVKKILRDVSHLPGHLRKYASELDLGLLDSRVNVELALPAHDRLVWDGLHRKMSDLHDLDISLLPFSELAKQFRIDPGWDGWTDLFPKAGTIKVAAVGHGLTDPAATHTGPPLSTDRQAYLDPQFVTVGSAV